MKLCTAVALIQWFSSRSDFVCEMSGTLDNILRALVITSGSIDHVIGTQWAETTEAAKYHTMHRTDPSDKKLSGSKPNSAEVGTPCSNARLKSQQYNKGHVRRGETMALGDREGRGSVGKWGYEEVERKRHSK